MIESTRSAEAVSLKSWASHFGEVWRIDERLPMTLAHEILGDEL
jgi:hypothetical protein